MHYHTLALGPSKNWQRIKTAIKAVCVLSIRVLKRIRIATKMFQVITKSIFWAKENPTPLLLLLLLCCQTCAAFQLADNLAPRPGPRSLSMGSTRKPFLSLHPNNDPLTGSMRCTSSVTTWGKKSVLDPVARIDRFQTFPLCCRGT